MAVALNTLPTGTFFSTNEGVVGQAQQNFLLSASTGTSGTQLVAYNITMAAIQQLDQATQVTVLTLSVGTLPQFSLT